MATAPAVERLFFGHGPVSIGVSSRYQTTDRERPLIAAEDVEAADRLADLLHSLSFVATRQQIEPDQAELPDGDAVVVCGPKSAPVGPFLLKADPALRMVQAGARWWIEEIATGARRGSPVDEPVPESGVSPACIQADAASPLGRLATAGVRGRRHTQTDSAPMRELGSSRRSSGDENAARQTSRRQEHRDGAIRA
ncbi:hypothetical protein AB0L41_48510 [Amycolatopsis mediterranei]|uniref:hypothetical protein n=1 Tax=Amycolatopsis mediterranei TaxID=33910 RepID=UPI0034136CDD